ncbi:hypothetical protein AB0K18_33655 [Nonomuraea sp. NPDC049421]|uniref:hypothetical protein n=1 Tax=Nonomuraea sp. NPDC049421 TaxID=3155275 RepID=UPI003414757D
MAFAAERRCAGGSLITPSGGPLWLQGRPTALWVVGLGWWAVASHDSDDEVLAGGFYDFFSDGAQLVDLQNPFDLVDKTGGEPEVAVGNASDGGDGFGGGEVVGARPTWPT